MPKSEKNPKPKHITSVALTLRISWRLQTMSSSAALSQKKSRLLAKERKRKIINY